MKPANLKTKIFLDSGFPEDTEKVLDLMGFLDGQTTNPSLVAKKLLAERSLSSPSLSEDELLESYKKIVQDISKLIPDGSVSIEVYADHQTKADQMVKQAREMNSWIPNAHIKLPTIPEGMRAAYDLVQEGIRVNMTLVFSQEQAAAVYAVTKTDKPVTKNPLKDVFLSPFIGRLDDQGENGMDIVTNVAQMYASGDGHVQILAASVRSYEHFLGSIAYGADIITCPMIVLERWAGHDFFVPDETYEYPHPKLRKMQYKDLSLNAPWQSFNLHHELTDAGLVRFAEDWNALMGK